MVETDPPFESRAGNQSSQSKFHAVVVPSVGEAHIITADTYLSLANALKRFVGQDVCVFPYEGVNWAISKGPLRRYLMGPDGSRAALFDEEVNLEVDATGSLSTSQLPKSSLGTGERRRA